MGLAERWTDAWVDRVRRGDAGATATVLVLMRLESAGDTTRIDELLEAVAAYGREDRGLLAWARRHYLRRRDYRRALHYAERQVFDDPEPGGPRLELAWCAHWAGRHALAIQWALEHAERGDLERTDAARLLVRASLRLGRFADALAFSRLAGVDALELEWLAEIVERGRRHRPPAWYGAAAAPPASLASLDLKGILRGRGDRALLRVDRRAGMEPWSKGGLEAERRAQEPAPWSDDPPSSGRAPGAEAAEPRGGAPFAGLAAVELALAELSVERSGALNRRPADVERDRGGTPAELALFAMARATRARLSARLTFGGRFSRRLDHAWLTVYRPHRVDVLECAPEPGVPAPPIPAAAAVEYHPIWSVDRSGTWYRHAQDPA